MGKFQVVQEIIRQSRESEDLDDLHGLIESTVAEFGFRYFLISHHVNAVGPNIVQLSNYPQDWISNMRRKTQFRADPVMQACQKAAAPFLWSELDRYISLTAQQREILERCAQAGFGAAFTVPVHVPGECSGSGSFVVEPGKMLDDSAMPHLQFITCFAFEAARRLVVKTDQIRVSNVRGLTDRQLDCIVLMAQGKSDWDVGKILGLSQRTVQQHIDAARKKYDVSTRTQLLVRTLFDNQLGFHDIIRA